MALREDFKEKLKAGQVADAFTMVLSEAIELEITTWVCATDSQAKTSSSDSEQPLPGQRLRTRINILEGEVENEVGSQFLGNSAYTELCQLHMQQVQNGRQTIEHNLESLQQIFTVLTNTITQVPQNVSKPMEVKPIFSAAGQETEY